MADRRGLRIALTALTALVIAGGALVLVQRAGSTRAPDFVVPDLAGNAVRLSALQGKVVLVNFWATWCAPCRDEMPSMQRLYDRLRGQGLELLAVSQDTDRAAVEGFVREYGVGFPILLDPERLAGDRYGVWGYPETFVVDRAGQIVERVIGPRAWDAPAEVAKLERLLAPPEAGG